MLLWRQLTHDQLTRLVLTMGLCLCPARADVLVLRNGERLEGIIREESDRALVLDIGMGAVTVDRGRVSAIERESPADNERRQERWRTTYVAPQALPEDLQAISRRFERLTGVRRRALEAAKKLPGAVQRHAGLEQQLVRAQARYRRTNEELAGTDMRSNVKAYNRKVAENNTLVAEVNRLRAGGEGLRAAMESMEQRVADYSREITIFEQDFRPLEERYLEEEGEEAPAAWVRKTAERLSRYQRDFQHMVIPVARDRGATTVEVRINDGPPAPFILDTGATLVTLTETLARRLNIAYDPRNPIPLRMADGSVAQGYPVELRSVQVGDARAEAVRAVVMDKPPAEGLQGLLGMTFLREFEISFDAKGRNLVLEKLSAR